MPRPVRNVGLSKPPRGESEAEGSRSRLKLSQRLWSALSQPRLSLAVRSACSRGSPVHRLNRRAGTCKNCKTLPTRLHAIPARRFSYRTMAASRRWFLLRRKEKQMTDSRGSALFARSRPAGTSSTSRPPRSYAASSRITPAASGRRWPSDGWTRCRRGVEKIDVSSPTKEGMLDEEVNYVEEGSPASGK